MRGRNLEAIYSLSDLESHYLNEALTAFIAKKVVQSGDTVFDLGANVGLHTVAFSNLVGDLGRVHAFEPNPSLFGYLTTIPNVRVWPVAVGSRLSLETFFLPVDNSEVGSLVDAREFVGDIPTRLLTVPQVPIDQIDELQEVTPSFIKIDVERYEFHAITGMLQLINRSKPVIVFETNTPQIELLLNNIGYQVASMVPSDMGITPANVVASARGVHDPVSFLPSRSDMRILIDQAITAARHRTDEPGQVSETNSLKPNTIESLATSITSFFRAVMIERGPRSVSDFLIAHNKSRLNRKGFDAEYYLAINTDVAESEMDALDHFVRHGQSENRPHRFR